MEESEGVAASAPAEEDITPSLPSSSSAFPVPSDHLAQALQTLFLNVTSVVQGELQVRWGFSGLFWLVRSHGVVL